MKGQDTRSGEAFHPWGEGRVPSPGNLPAFGLECRHLGCVASGRWLCLSELSVVPLESEATSLASVSEDGLRHSAGAR